MNTIIHRAGTRGHSDHGWLNSYHSFSFAGYHNPERVRFGLLRVLNDDVVEAGMGFGKHPHDNMEIISIPLGGTLSHKDSAGRSEVIKTNDVQIMSAGSGIFHSEMNASSTEEVNFLQIWIFPKDKNIAPRYEQKTFDPAARVNQWQVVVSPDEKDGGIWINQDAWFSLAKLEAGKSLSYKQNITTNGVYLFVLEGEVKVNDQNLYKRDGMGIVGADVIGITANKNAELLVMEIPMN
ncbi:MAG: pirin family protein [Sphingobacteriales bacterium]|nr:pirin family protein [Sphingobacteriales bacterium]MBI3717832.1 pirin family protein [Sphingobacteriales bacterium]